jgi:hypothetical protein
MISCAGILGDSQCMRVGLALNPQFTIARHESADPYQSFPYSAGRQVIVEGLRKVGCQNDDSRAAQT